MSRLPEYRPDFPLFNPIQLENLVPKLEPSGIDLLTVSTFTVRDYVHGISLFGPPTKARPTMMDLFLFVSEDRIKL